MPQHDISSYLHNVPDSIVIAQLLLQAWLGRVYMHASLALSATSIGCIFP